MKKLILFVMAILISFILTGCSDVSQSEYQKALDGIFQLETELNSLQMEINKLQTQIDKYESDNSKLKATLTTTYDAYRYMMLYVTTGIYGNTLSKSKWEAYITKNEHPAPTFDEVNELVTK